MPVKRISIMGKSVFDFDLILSQFLIKGIVTEIKPFGSGHIHDTFHIVNADHSFPDYLLQRINNKIFKNIQGLTNNILLVTDHLRKKLENIPGSDPDKEVLTLIPSNTGEGYFLDDNGNYWRMFYFLKNTRSYDLVQTTHQACEGGKAFGKFLALLSDLDARCLEETIPHFHDVENRFRLLQKAIELDSVGRIKEVQMEIAFVEKRIESMSMIGKSGRQGILPLRITHNDTKFNNVLLDENDQAQCVIDLDTVMPGYVAYDYGDAIRTIVNKAPEDESNLEKIEIDIELFKGFTKGFMEQTIGFITASEIDSLFRGALLMPFMMGLRFLTDYIEGDVYYKTYFPKQNIQRSRAQFRLVEKLEENEDVLRGIIDETAELVLKE